MSKEAVKERGQRAKRAAEGSLAEHPFCSLCENAGGRSASEAACPSAVLRLPLRAGVRLFERDSTGDVVYVLHSGVVKETMPGPEGRDCIVRLASRNHVVGLCALLGVPHRHSAYVLHPGVACRIPVARLQRLLTTDSTVIERLQRDWQQAVDDADRIVADLGQGPARARLARALLYLREAAGPDEPLHLRRRDLAELLAIVPVSVARLLGEFRREGLIEEMQRRCTHLDTARLRAIAQGRG